LVIYGRIPHIYKEAIEAAVSLLELGYKLPSLLEEDLYNAGIDIDELYNLYYNGER